MWEPRRLTTFWPSTAYHRDGSTFLPLRMTCQNNHEWCVYKDLERRGQTSFKVFTCARIILSFDSSVSIETGYGLDGRESIPITGNGLFSSQRPKRLWGLPNHLSIWHHGLFPRGGGGKCGWGMKLTIHFRLVPRSRMAEIYLHSPHVFMCCA
jgi:hypothetical protein